MRGEQYLQAKVRISLKYLGIEGMTSERLWALQGGLIVFGKGVPIISDPLVFPNKDSNVDTNSCPEEFIMK